MTEEEKKELEKAQKELETLIEKKVKEGTDASTEEVVKMQNKLKTITDGLENIKKEMIETTETIKKLGDKQVKVENEKPISIANAILEAFKEAGINTYADLRKNVNAEMTLKTTSTDSTAISNDSYTGDYGRTKPVGDVKFPNERPLAFLDKVFKGVVEQDKNTILWTVGTFTESVGYAGELTDITADTIEGGGINTSVGTATDATRKMSKVAARMILSAETFEDLSQFAQRLEQKLLEKTNLWLDKKIWDGDGDGSHTTHIYGVVTAQCTAFSTVNPVLVVDANVGDLADQAALQVKASGYTPTTVWVSPKTAYKYAHTKDRAGNYIINRLADGTMVMAGMKVVESSIFDAGASQKMLVGDPLLIQLWQKRNPSLEIVRNAKTDSYDVYVYTRNQVLVENEDIKGLIYIANIDTALAAISDDAPTQNVAITSPLNDDEDAIQMEEKTA